MSWTTSELIAQVRGRNLTYLDEQALADLYTVVSSMESKGVAGALVEAGCALGGSSIVMTYAKSRTREFYVYDNFAMIPSPSERDGSDVIERYRIIENGESAGIGGDLYYGYRKDLIADVKSTFADFGLDAAANRIHFVKGLFDDTLNINFPVAMAHIDCDWYGSVMVCLTRIVPNLAIGGTLVIDDYHAWSGCARAVDEYFADKHTEFDFTDKSRLHVVKRSPLKNAT